jgi:uncharacterized membrane protein
MPKPSTKHLHKEFDLERLILFSDAVFAIAITLLIIEIHFPEAPENIHDVSFFKLFKPTIIQYIGFVLSFFFIGSFWAKHLRLCRLLIAYDTGVITLNLFFLFFIVSFPFTASGITEHIHPGYLAPVFIYIVNVGLVALMMCLLSHYIFYKKPHLTLPDHTAEKRYIYRQSLNNVFMIGSIVLMTTIASVFFENALQYSFLAVPLIAAVSRRKLKKLKQEMKKEQAGEDEEEAMVVPPQEMGI